MGRQKYTGPNRMYVVGNNAVKLNDYARPERNHDEKRHKKQGQQRGIIRKRRSVFVTLAFYMAVVATLFICALLLKEQFGVYEVSSTIDDMKVSLKDLQHTNNQMEASMNQSIDYEEVYRAATEDLGMVLPDSNQVQYIYKDKVSFTNQYVDIKPVEDNQSKVTTNVLGLIGW